MTTNISPTGRGRHLLDAHDPAELLAEARLCLREPPSDCLILASTGGLETPAMITRSSLTDLLAPGGGADLERHLALMRERGGSALHALIVIGDGYQRLLEPVTEEVLRRAGTTVLEAVQTLGPAPFGLLSLRGAASSSCWELSRSRRDDTLRLSHTGPLRPFSDTRAAATAVLVGRPIPRPERADPRLREIGLGLRLPAPDLASDEDPGALFAAARDALETLGGGAGELTDPETMTKCEQLAPLLSAIAVDRLHWELLAQCVEHGGTTAIDRESLLQALVSDAQWVPHEDVCAGGRWYVALEKLRLIAASATEGASSGERGTARSAWRALTALLVLLAWWNHRFATAGRLVDELWDREPDSTLAPLLSRMTDTPIFPAWWPST
ncbi:MAG: hypothetical protein GX960_08175 [Actinomycetales bacterium]|nr:hypothetical protein [Actinomycetales bacterium]